MGGIFIPLGFGIKATRYGKADVFKKHPLNKEIQGNNYFKSQDSVISGRRKGFDWNRAPKRTSGVADKVLFLDVDGDFKYVCLVILY